LSDLWFSASSRSTVATNSVFSFSYKSPLPARLRPAAIPAADYAQYIGEAALRDSYLKAPYFKPQGYPAGIYRVGPLARLNVAEQTGTPVADRERSKSASHGATTHVSARLGGLGSGWENMLTSH